MRAALTRALLAACLATTLAAQAPGTLIDAVKSGNAAAAHRLLKQGSSGHAAEADGTTALHWAVRADDEALARALLRAGARPSAANRYGVTPLALAAVNGNARMVALLLEAGADPNAAHGDGETVLMTAARTGRPEPLTLLLARGADPNAREGAFGETALMWAAAHDHGEAVKALVAAGAELDARTRPIELPKVKVDLATMVTTALPRGGLTALMLAARQGARAGAIALLEAGANPDLADPDGTTALLYAIINVHFDVAAALVERGADPDVADVAGMAALYAAVDMQQPDPLINRPRAKPSGRMSASELVPLLLKHGANPNGRLKSPLLMRQHNTGDASLGNGATPLMRAAKIGDVELVRTLLAGGADPSLAMANGTTTMMVALAGRGARALTPEAPAFQMIRLMLERGADVNATNPGGETLLHQGVGRGEAFVRLLAEHGANLHARDKGGRTPLDVALGVAPAGGGAGGARGRGGRGGGAGGPTAPASEATVALLKELMQAR
jgi:ankyrin repeat protein